MLEKLTIKDFSFENQKVLMRVDFNVPLTKQGSIADIARIQETLPSIEHILSKKGSIILISHMGRPDGRVDKKFSLEICQKQLELLLKRPVAFEPDCIGISAQKSKSSLRPGDILLLENLRFYPAEENPEQDPSFAKQLAQGCDIFINDAFGAAHRKHSSITEVPLYFPKKSGMGFLMEKEYLFLKKNIDQPKRPFYALIGGAKVSSKLGVITSLFDKVDKIFIGGAMAFTFLKCMGFDVGNSYVEDNQIAHIKKFLELNAHQISKIFFPIDILAGKSPDDTNAPVCLQLKDGIAPHLMGLDIGPQTLKAWSQALESGATYFWNGPMGVFENPLFREGTASIAQILAKQQGVKIVGGGDSVAAINLLHLSKNFSHLSTGGGASLELIEYGHLPGIDALSNKNS